MLCTGDHGPFNRCSACTFLLVCALTPPGASQVLFRAYLAVPAYCFSWDRQAYLTDIRDGTPSLVPAQNNITKNLLFNSYSSTWPLVSPSHTSIETLQ